jgi:hypothetical protein
VVITEDFESSDSGSNPDGNLYNFNKKNIYQLKMNEPVIDIVNSTITVDEEVYPLVDYVTCS